MISKLNWETYKTIPNKLKEEYNYKFGDVPKLSVSIITNTLIFALLISIILLFSIYIINTLDLSDEIVEKSFILADAANMLMNSTMIFLVCIFILDLINIIIWFITRRKWLKENNIKIKYPLIEKILSFRK